jgi:ubiquinone/menaquinone biosynthesis C-methylase UbiE
MGFYSKYIFPWVMDKTLGNEPFTAFRQNLLAEVQGNVLEIGFGTGLNMPHYNAAQVENITAIDPNPGMLKKARRRMDHSSIRVDHHLWNGEQLPVENAIFDVAVSTWTLCSIPDVKQALREIHRALKPGGKFYFIEHGLCDDPKLQKWQHRLTPLQKIFGDGCHLNRNMKTLLEEQAFQFLKLDQFYAEKLPRIAGYMYRGVAEKAPG